MKQKLYIIFFLLALVVYSRGNKADSLLNLLKTNIHDSVKLDVFNKLSFELKNVNPPQSVEFALKAVDLALKRGIAKEIARARHTAGTIYYIEANYTEALKHYLESLKFREKMNDSINMAKAYNNIALVYYELEDFSAALKFHFKSINIKLKRNDLQGLASSYGNVGNLYFDMAQSHELKSENKIADSLLKIAKMYQLKALDIQQKLVALNPKDENLYGVLSGTYNNLGNIALELSIINPEDVVLMTEALEQHQRALALQRKYNDLRGASHSYINIAGVYDRMKKYDLAIKEYNNVLNLLKDFGMGEEQKAIYEGLSYCYEKKGDFKNSFFYYKKYTAIKDSIFNETRSEQIAEMQEKYEAEKKENQIQMLSKDKMIVKAELENEKILKRSYSFGLILSAIILVLVAALLVILWNRYQLKNKSAVQLEKQNTIIRLKNKEITDSIEYAHKIQLSILPPQQLVNRIIPDSFIFYKPKDIVSGDFYWMEEWGGKIFVAVADCTGHGVPGAFMSIVGNNLLDHAVTVYGLDKPAAILAFVSKQMNRILHQSGEDLSEIKDGMDICLLVKEKGSNKIEFSGAYNSLWIVRNESVIELRADRIAVGDIQGIAPRNFTNHEFITQSGDMIYMASDGFTDQFGGPAEKKFKQNRLNELYIKLSKDSCVIQKDLLEKEFDSWKGNLEQVDDVCVMGVRVQ